MVSYELLRLSLVFAGLIPAILLLAAIFVSRAAPFRAASLVTIGAAGLAAASVTLHTIFLRITGDDGPMLRGLVQLDLVSSVMLLLVCVLSIVVVRYSRTYLGGEGDLVRYVRSLLLTIAAVTGLVVSNNLGVLMVGWAVSAIGLHQLLTFYRKRRLAIIVAHKKFLLAQIANVAFLAALALVENEIGSLRIDVLNAYAQSKATLPPSLHLATVLLVIGVLLKTAQLPFHGWILQVMEAPTPVSALLHAGVVNIGGFVMIRLAPLMAHAWIAQGMLLWVGLITAIVGSLVMTTHASIKVVLAWSTIAQMGFMLVQCGLGVWHLALLHLLAHSLYKAHAFLSSGNIVDTWRGTSLVKAAKPSWGFMIVGIVMVCLGATPLYVGFSRMQWHASTSFVAFSVALGLSFVPMIGRALAAGVRAFVLAAVFAFGAAASYFAWHALFEELAPWLDGSAAAPFKWTVVVGGLAALFVAQTMLQASPNGFLARALQPHFLSGLYIDDWFTRLTFRVWPPRLERPATTSRRSSVILEQR